MALMIAAVVAVLLLVAWIFPPWFTLILGYPLGRVAASWLTLPPLVSWGELDLRVEDVLLLGVGLKVLWLLATERSVRWRVGFSMRGGLLAFVAVTTAATAIAGIRFGKDFFYGELISWARFLLNNVFVFVLLVASLNNEITVRKAIRFFRYLGYLAAIFIFISVFMFPRGIVIGEVNFSDEYVRHQGLFGDSVKLMLLPFVITELALGSHMGAMVLVVALLFTGGRAGLIGLTVGILMLGFATKWRLVKSQGVPTILGLSLVLGLVLGLGWWMNWGGIAVRFRGLEMEIGVARYWAGWLTAGRMISDHWLLGLGFGGYRFFASEYETIWVGVPPIRTEAPSQVLKVAVDSGIIGVVVFLWMMLDFILLAAASGRWMPGGHFWGQAMLGIVLTMLALSFFVEPWMLPASHVSYVFFLGMALCAGAQAALAWRNYSLVRNALHGSSGCVQEISKSG